MRKLTTIRIGKGQFTCNTLLLFILFVGLVFKGVYLYSYALKSPYYDSPSMDSAVYVNWANLINQEGWLGKNVFYWAPLYPYLLSIIFRIFPHSLLATYIIQLIMGLCSVYLIYLIGRRIYSERAGLVAAGLSLLYSPFTFFETKILPTVTSIFLTLLFLYLLTRAEQEKKYRYWIGGAVALGFASLCRPNYVLMIPLLTVGLLLFYRKKLRQVFVPILILTFIPGIIIGTVTLRNYIVVNDFIPISASAGLTFAQGNNPWTRGAIKILPGFSGEIRNQQHEETRIAETAVGRELKPSEVSRFWFRWSLNFIRNYPIDYLKLILYKMAAIVNSHELGNNYLLSIDEAVTPSLRLAFLPFGFIFAWAVLDLIFLVQRRPPPLTLLASFVAGLLMLLLFYVSSRYRLTLAPAAIIMAGGGIDYLLSNPNRLKISLIAVVTVFSLSLPPFLPMSEAQLSKAHSRFWGHLATAYKDNNRLEEAFWAYEKAISKDPYNYDFYLSQINVLAGLNRDQEDIMRWTKELSDRFVRELEKIIVSESQDYRLYLRAGIMLGRVGRHVRARDVLLKGLQLSPENIDLQYNYALACAKSGNIREAVEMTRKIIIHAPYFAKARWLLEQIDQE
jgi:4-amino-4-deoxy-L-arabinose transferase-like glycosyltransferase